MAAGQYRLRGAFWVATVAVALMLCACETPVQSTVSAAAATGTSAAATGQAPSIRGSPVTIVAAGSAFSFTPTAAAANQEPLSFSIVNKPAWTTFNLATGALTGTPSATDVGNYPGIVIRVSDNEATTDLPAFTLLVTPPSANFAALSWVAPTQKTDGSPLTDLAGYWVMHGSVPDSLMRIAQITDPGTTAYLTIGLPSGVHYFAVTAYTQSGTESAMSNIASKTIP